MSRDVMVRVRYVPADDITMITSRAVEQLATG